MPRRRASMTTAVAAEAPGGELEHYAPLRRTPGKEKYWRQQLAAQSASGLSVAKYCERSGLNVNNFHWWVREIRERDKVNAVEMIGAEYRKLMNGVAEEEKADSSPFVPVKIAESALRTTPASVADSEIGANGSLEIVLGSGATIRVTDSTPMKLLLRVLKMLEEEKC